jgi:hypothetical protein
MDSYDTGRFPPKWSEWNGRYRDTLPDSEEHLCVHHRNTTHDQRWIRAPPLYLTRRIGLFAERRTPRRTPRVGR